MGFHLVQYFVTASTFTSVSVVTRSAATSNKKIDGAAYYSGNITDHNSMKQLLSQIKPVIIIHAISPSPVKGTPKEYLDVSLQGT